MYGSSPGGERNRVPYSPTNRVPYSPTRLRNGIPITNFALQVAPTSKVWQWHTRNSRSRSRLASARGEDQSRNPGARSRRVYIESRAPRVHTDTLHSSLAHMIRSSTCDGTLTLCHTTQDWSRSTMHKSHGSRVIGASETSQTLGHVNTCPGTHNMKRQRNAFQAPWGK